MTQPGAGTALISTRRAPTILPALVCFIAVVLAVVAMLLASGLPLDALVRYVAYIVFWVVAPGLVLHRTLRGAQTTWGADISLGAATGIAAGLIAWVMYSAAGLQHWLWTWPVLAALPLLSRRARRRAATRPTEYTAALPVAAVAVAALAALFQLQRTYFTAWDLPPTARPYYSDLLWHMSLANEAMRSFPLMSPQSLFAAPIKYHWFANADIALAALISGLDVPVLLLRLWPAFLVPLIIVLVAVVGRQISGRASVGAVAALVTAMTTFLVPLWPVLDVQDVFRPISPSQLYAFIPLLLILSAGITLATSRRVHVGALILIIAALCVAAGSKPTVLPMVIAGSVVGTAAAAIMRGRWGAFAAVLGVACALQVVSSAVISGGNDGMAITLFSGLTLFGFVRTLLEPSASSSASFLLPGMFTRPSGGLAVGALAAISAVRPLLGAAPLFNRELRLNATAWWLAGMAGAGAAGFLLLAHPTYSQLYFAHTAVPVGAIVGAWWLVSAIGDRVWAARLAIVSAILAASLAWAAAFATRNAADWAPELILRILAWIGVIGLAMAMAACIAAIAWRRAGHRMSGPGTVIVLAGLMGAMLGSLPAAALLPPSAPLPEDARQLSESEAALWIAENTDADAVLAVNDHCAGEEAPVCDSRVYWASGLAGRRVLLESWSYIPESADLAPDTIIRPAFDLTLLEFNQSLFTGPTADSTAEARSLGVDYLVATLGATEVSAELNSYCTTVFENDHVLVCALMG
jgi:hypothetical protein